MRLHACETGPVSGRLYMLKHTNWVEFVAVADFDNYFYLKLSHRKEEEKERLPAFTFPNQNKTKTQPGGWEQPLPPAAAWSSTLTDPPRAQAEPSSRRTTCPLTPVLYQ